MSLQVTKEIIARQSPEAQGIIRALLAEIAELRAELEELRRQLKGNTPQNSSLPPSTQHPHPRPAPPQRKSKKRRGGQPGHAKHQRPLLLSKDCDEVQEFKPTECRRCGGRLTGRDPEPLRHQVWELPEIRPLVTEYRRHRLACPGCGETTCAELPAGVPQGQSGPRLTAFAALLMAYYRQSKRRTAEFLGALLGQPCCPALAVKMQTQVTAALRPAYDELAAQLPTHAPREHRRNGDQGVQRQGVAMDVRGPRVHRLRAATHAGSDGAGRSADGSVPRRGDLRSSQNVLAHRPFTMVLGAPDSRFSSAHRQRRWPGQTPGLRLAAIGAEVVSALEQLPRAARSPAPPCFAEWHRSAAR